MNDSLKGHFFRDLKALESFEAQISLEDETHNSLLTTLLRIDLTKPNVELEYARLRGSLDVLRSLKTNRERLIEEARSRDKNS
jgi:hypothetical protein